MKKKQKVKGSNGVGLLYIYLDQCCLTPSTFLPMYCILEEKLKKNNHKQDMVVYKHERSTGSNGVGLLYISRPGLFDQLQPFQRCQVFKVSKIKSELKNQAIIVYKRFKAFKE